MVNGIEKPLSIAREDLLNGLIDLINNSYVPTLLVEPMLENILAKVKMINKQQLEADRISWAKQNESLEDEE